VVLQLLEKGRRVVERRHGAAIIATVSNRCSLQQTAPCGVTEFLISHSARFRALFSMVHRDGENGHMFQKEEESEKTIMENHHGSKNVRTSKLGWLHDVHGVITML